MTYAGTKGRAYASHVFGFNTLLYQPTDFIGYTSTLQCGGSTWVLHLVFR